MNLNNSALGDILPYLAAIGGAFLILIIFAAVAAKAKSINNSKKPIMTRKAKLLEKAKISEYSSDEYFTFETEDGKRVKIRGKDQFLVIGDEGMLTWQGDRLLSFKR